jgi:hypothetical protein
VDLTHLIIPMSKQSLKANNLYDYAYGQDGVTAILFGMHMFYNHHPNPNLQVTYFAENMTPDRPLGFVATRSIPAGEQLFTTYDDQVGGQAWFDTRGLEMQRPKESKIGPEDLVRYQTDYCSKIYAWVGMPTWSNQIRNMLPMAFWTHQLRLAPFDAGFADAKGKVKMHQGDRIEISIGLMLSLPRWAPWRWYGKICRTSIKRPFVPCEKMENYICSIRGAISTRKRRIVLNPLRILSFFLLQVI